jgi:hypothetical protein
VQRNEKLQSSGYQWEKTGQQNNQAYDTAIGIFFIFSLYEIFRQRF